MKTLKTIAAAWTLAAVAATLATAQTVAGGESDVQKLIGQARQQVKGQPNARPTPVAQVIELTPANYNAVVSTSSKVFLAYYDPGTRGWSAVPGAMEALARKYQGKVVFARFSNRTAGAAALQERYGLGSVPVMPTFLMIDRRALPTGIFRRQVGARVEAVREPCLFTGINSDPGGFSAEAELYIKTCLPGA